MLRLVRPVSTSFRVLASRSEQLIRQTSRISGLASKSPCHSSILQRPSSIFVARRWITQSSIKPCPSCSEPLPTSLLICPKCSYIHSVPPEQSYHEIFGLTYEPNPYDIDTSALRKKFILLQGVVHPDKWSGKPRVRFVYSICYIFILNIL